MRDDAGLMTLGDFWHVYIATRDFLGRRWWWNYEYSGKMSCFTLNDKRMSYNVLEACEVVTLRFITQTIFLFLLTFALSGIGALVQVNFFSGMFLVLKDVKEIVSGLIFVLLLYVNFRYCFPDQLAELRGRNVRSDRYPVWVRQYILFNCALFVEEVFYYTIKDLVSLSEVVFRLLGFLIFASVYAYMMSSEEFKIKW
ncbi:hypothetical protein HV782_017705 [Pseudomonas monsensis]|uniref:hypothetical protein n=1 Tax=Pseudomonas monsensis TaxID=2745509 RepID=UPI001648CBE6|nr:hypothetical protein [Pseudomonas monsensis]QXH98400.1 hypothetical protein HV782_017705 [Pseudomonas monsensis]